MSRRSCRRRLRAAELGEGNVGAARVAPRDRAHADGEQLAVGVEAARAGQLVEGARLDHVARAHVGEKRLQSRGAARRAHRRLHRVECRARHGEAPELEGLVKKPRETVIVAHGDAKSLAFHPCIGSVEGRLVGGSRVMPHAELHKDVRRHVQRVARSGRHLRVGARRGQRQARVRRIVVIMDQVVQRPGVVGAKGEDRAKDRRRFSLHGAANERMLVLIVARIAKESRTARRGAHERQCEECPCLEVGRIRASQLAHRLAIGTIARCALARSVQRLDGPQVALLALGRRQSQPRLRCRRKPCERRARGVGILVEPQRLVAGHRLAPVRHGKAAVVALSLAKRLDGVLVLEVVERLHAAQECGLRGSRAGVGKAHRGSEQQREQDRGCHGSRC